MMSCASGEQMIQYVHLEVWNNQVYLRHVSVASLIFYVRLVGRCPNESLTICFSIAFLLFMSTEEVARGGVGQVTE